MFGEISRHRFPADLFSAAEREEFLEKPARAADHATRCNTCRQAQGEQQASLNEFIEVIRTALIRGHAVTLRPGPLGYETAVEISEGSEVPTKRLGRSTTAAGVLSQGFDNIGAVRPKSVRA
jgi:hypothetical protein